MPYMRHGGTLDYTVSEVIEPVIRDQISGVDGYVDLVEQYDEESVEAAVEDAMAEAVDAIHCDLEVLIGQWMEWHGCQIIEMLDPSAHYEEEEDDDDDEDNDTDDASDTH